MQTTPSYSTPIYNTFELKKQKRRLSRFGSMKSTTSINYRRHGYYKIENSSCDEDILLSSPNQRRFLRRLSNNDILPNENYIPKQNYKLRLLLDRIDQELEKVRRKYTIILTLLQNTKIK